MRKPQEETRLFKSAKTMTWASITALVLAMLFRASPGYQTVMQLVVCAGAILAVFQATRTASYFWAAGFSAIALLYNPIVPIALSHNIFPVLVSLVMFGLSLAILKTEPPRARLVLANSRTNRSSLRGVTTVTWS